MCTFNGGQINTFPCNETSSSSCHAQPMTFKWAGNDAGPGKEKNIHRSTVAVRSGRPINSLAAWCFYECQPRSKTASEAVQPPSQQEAIATGAQGAMLPAVFLGWHIWAVCIPSVHRRWTSGRAKTGPTVTLPSQNAPGQPSDDVFHF